MGWLPRRGTSLPAMDQRAPVSPRCPWPCETLPQNHGRSATAPGCRMPPPWTAPYQTIRITTSRFRGSFVGGCGGGGVGADRGRARCERVWNAIHINMILAALKRHGRLGEMSDHAEDDGQYQGG